MKKIGLFAKLNTDEAIVIAKEFLSYAEEKNLLVILEKNLAESINHPDSLPGDEISQAVDLIIVLGGDGTLLSVVQQSKDKLVPILGVNLGHLGFLTEVQKEEFYQVLENVLQGNFSGEERMMFEVRHFREGRIIFEGRALNDAVVRGALARIITVDAYVNEEYINSFRADGVIISTPTGSTAYSLASGGPIVHPALPAIIFTPISPHILTNRPIVIPGDCRVRVVLTQSSEGALLNIDGQKWQNMQEGDEVESDAPLVDLETDKIVLEVPSTANGTVSDIKTDVGAVVKTGQVLMVLGEIPAEQANNKSTVVSRDSNKTAMPLASPAANKIATENNVDLSILTGTGKNQRITKQDVLTFIGQRNEGQQPELKKTTTPAKAETAPLSTLTAESSQEQKTEQRQRRVPMSPLRKRGSPATLL